MSHSSLAEGLRSYSNKYRDTEDEQRAHLDPNGVFWQTATAPGTTTIEAFINLMDPTFDIEKRPDVFRLTKRGDPLSSLNAPPPTDSSPSSAQSATPTTSRPQPASASTAAKSSTLKGPFKLGGYVRRLGAPLDQHIAWAETALEALPGDSVRQGRMVISLNKLKEKVKAENPMVYVYYSGVSVRFGGKEREEEDLRELWDLIEGEDEDGDESDGEKEEKGDDVEGKRKRRMMSRYKNYVEVTGTARFWDTFQVEMPGARKEDWTVVEMIDARAHQGIHDLEESLIDFTRPLCLNSGPGGSFTHRTFKRFESVQSRVLGFTSALAKGDTTLWNDFVNKSEVAKAQLPLVKKATPLPPLPIPTPRPSSSSSSPTESCPEASTSAPATVASTTRPSTWAYHASPAPTSSTASFGTDPSALSNLSSQSPAAPSEQPSPHPREEQLPELISMHFEDMATKFQEEHEAIGMREEPMSEEFLQNCVDHASALRVLSSGHVSVIRTQKDASRLAVQKGVKFWRPLAAGPSLLRRTVGLARGLSSAALDPKNIAVPLIAIWFESFINFWSVTLIHILILIAIIFFSRFFLFTRPQLIISTSAKLAPMFIQNFFAKIWLQNIPPFTYTAFVFGTDSSFLSYCISDTIPDKPWNEYPIHNFSKIIGVSMLSAVGVDENGEEVWSAVVFTSDYGRPKYDQVTARPLVDLLFLVELKILIFITILDFLNPGNNKESLAAARIICEAVCLDLGVFKAIEKARRDYQNLQHAVSSERVFSAMDRARGSGKARDGEEEDGEDDDPEGSDLEGSEEDEEVNEASTRKSHTMSTTIIDYHDTLPRAIGERFSKERRDQGAAFVEEYYTLFAEGKERFTTIPPIVSAPCGSPAWWAFFEGPFGNDPKRFINTEEELAAYLRVRSECKIPTRKSGSSSFTPLTALYRLASPDDTAPELPADGRFGTKTRLLDIRCHNCELQIIGTSDSRHACGVEFIPKKLRPKNENWVYFTDDNATQAQLFTLNNILSHPLYSAELPAIDPISHTVSIELGKKKNKSSVSIYITSAADTLLSNTSILRRWGISELSVKSDLISLGVDGRVATTLSASSGAGATPSPTSNEEEWLSHQAELLLIEALAEKTSLPAEASVSGAFCSKAGVSTLALYGSSLTLTTTATTFLDAMIKGSSIHLLSCPHTPKCAAYSLDTINTPALKHKLEATDLDTLEQVDHVVTTSRANTAISARWTSFLHFPIPIIRRIVLGARDYGVRDAVFDRAMLLDAAGVSAAEWSGTKSGIALDWSPKKLKDTTRSKIIKHIEDEAGPQEMLQVLRSKPAKDVFCAILQRFESDAPTVKELRAYDQ